MRRHTGFGWLELVVGVLLIILGIATLIKPGSVLTGVIVVYGIIALLTGIDDIIFYAKMEQHMGFGPTISLISGILSVLAGMILLVHPAAGKWALALLLPMWFIAHCIARLSHLNIIRFTAGNGMYYFSMVMNILGLLLGCLMLVRPAVTLFSFGWIIGIYLIVLGADSVVLGCSKLGSNW